MTQYENVTIDPTVTNGSQLAANINSWRKAALTLHSGVERPSYASAGTMWISTASSPWKLCVYDGTDDVVIGELKPDSHDFVSAGGTEYTNDLMASGDAAEARDKLGAVSKSGDVMTGWLKVEFDSPNLAELKSTGATDARLKMCSDNGGNSYVEFGQRHNGDAYIWSRGKSYNFRSDGYLTNGSWQIAADGNINGSIWGNWGSNWAYTAIGNRIEDRAAAHANNKAPKGARIQHDSGTYDIGGCDIGYGDYTVDCAGSQALTGLQCFSGRNQWLRLRAKYLRNY
ncbi:hypothetical protein [Martelella mediterranea]|uniref:Uncharacterized protein n=1 Tax=Martelella mediterranea TaxID=293089 RepID=A0A4R3NWQ2_9HYPH|nr:hypothetical protein [Martelella mediterranea]TCT42793.1 hypothetical protein EDC90_100494 [Martelella mediterranea]